MENFISRYPVHTEIKVAWGEMDALQHINNVAYFRYFETARIDFLRQTGLIAMLQDKQTGPVLSETTAKYKRPVTYPDTLIVGAYITDIQEDRFVMHYEVFSKAQQTVTTTGSAKVVMFNFKTGQKAALPDHVLEVLHQHCRDKA